MVAMEKGKTMADREKLIEILESAESAFYWDSNDKGFIQKIADHLLANGVTFVSETIFGGVTKNTTGVVLF